MPIGEAIYLGFVVSAFIAFGIVLAAVNWYERSGAHKQQPAAQKPVRAKSPHKLAA